MYFLFNEVYIIKKIAENFRDKSKGQQHEQSC